MPKASYMISRLDDVDNLCNTVAIWPQGMVLEKRLERLERLERAARAVLGARRPPGVVFRRLL